jgi:hypothetical protein
VNEKVLAHWGLSRQKQTNLPYDGCTDKSQLQDDQKVCAPDDYSKKTSKIILNSFYHLP